MHCKLKFRIKTSIETVLQMCVFSSPRIVKSQWRVSQPNTETAAHALQIMLEGGKKSNINWRPIWDGCWGDEKKVVMTKNEK